MTKEKKSVLMSKCLLKHHRLTPLAITIFVFDEVKKDYSEHGPEVILGRCRTYAKAIFSYQTNKSLLKYFRRPELYETRKEKIDHLSNAIMHGCGSILKRNENINTRRLIRAYKNIQKKSIST